MPLALVTASARRLGRAMALELARRGYDLALHCHTSQHEADALAQDIQAMGQQAVVLPCDLSQEAETAQLVTRAQAAFGTPVSVLVNNASLFQRDEVMDVTQASWEAHMRINLRAPFVLTQALARALPGSMSGLVVNMLDTRVLNLTPHFTSYSLSKAGLATLTQTLALALAPRVRVVGIAPGFTLPAPGQSQAQFDAKAAQQPLARAASAADITTALGFFLDSPSVTGHILPVDAGQHLNWKA